MHLDPVTPAGASAGATRQLESALERIGVTPAHRTMVLLVLLGVMFDVFEQNAVGLIGTILREDWKLGAGDIGLLNTITFAAAAIGRLGSGLLADRFGRRLMLNANLLLFTLGATICALAPNYASSRAAASWSASGWAARSSPRSRCCRSSARRNFAALRSA